MNDECSRSNAKIKKCSYYRAFKLVVVRVIVIFLFVLFFFTTLAIIWLLQVTSFNHERVLVQLNIYTLTV